MCALPEMSSFLSHPCIESIEDLESIEELATGGSEDGDIGQTEGSLVKLPALQHGALFAGQEVFCVIFC